MGQRAAGSSAAHGPSPSGNQAGKRGHVVWKNRHRVSVKLKPDNANNLDEFQVLTGLNDNESLNFIVSAFFNG